MPGMKLELIWLVKTIRPDSSRPEADAVGGSQDCPDDGEASADVRRVQTSDDVA